jgi:hypothetical protein
MTTIRDDRIALFAKLKDPASQPRALPPRSGHGICGYAASGSVAGVWVLS